MARSTLGVIIGNRDFFPVHLVTEARRDIVAACAALDIEPILLEEHDTKLGAVETWQHAKACAELFDRHRRRIDGVLVSLPNFGDEKGVADTLKLAALNVPVLIQGYPDDLDKLNPARRRDAFCGKISVCNNLTQYGIPYSLTKRHTLSPTTEEFRSELERFVGVCKTVRGLRRARIGAIGARPNAFNTTRYSEKLLEASGITVNTLDLSEVLDGARALSDDDPRVKARLADISGYAPTTVAVKNPALLLMAKFGVIVFDWMEALDLDASAIQCWSSLQKNYGVNCCTVMSMMSEKLMPSACEVDVAGTVAMYALQLASGKPSALVDWNNNYGDDPNKCVFFHCGNWAKAFLPDIKISTAPILGTVLGEENTAGALEGRTPAGPVTFARVSTDDRRGLITSYVGEGRFTDDPLQTFGTRAVVEVPRLQELMHFICRQGFEHHTAMNASHTAGVLGEAFERYLGWEVYRHGADA